MGKYVYAFGIGWVIYMIGVILTAYEGVLTLIFQPFVAAITSFTFTLFAVLAGQIFQIQKLYNGWKDLKVIRYIIWVIGLILLFFPILFGHYTKMADPTTGETTINIPIRPLMFVLLHQRQAPCIDQMVCGLIEHRV